MKLVKPMQAKMDYHTGSVSDTHMGTTDFNMLCGTCGGDMYSCMGHHGHIELSHPVPNTELLTVLEKVLSCVCYHCGRLLIPDDDPFRKRGLADLAAHARKNYRVCTSYAQRTGETEDHAPGCGSAQPVWSVQDHVYLRAEYHESITPEDVQAVLFQIDKNEALCVTLGFNPPHSIPSGMMWEHFWVPDMIVRPWHGRSREDGITTRLRTIMKTNAKVPLEVDLVGKCPEYDALVLDVAVYQNDGRQAKKKMYGTSNDSLAKRYKGKRGRIRHHLIGKRAGGSARTVITGSPNDDVRRVGIPLCVCKKLDFPTPVNAYNVDHLTDLVRNGPDNYPGANAIVKLDGTEIDLRHVNRDLIELQQGWIVKVHILDGDPVVINRQPTLHCYGMIGLLARPLLAPDQNTFQLHVCVLPGLNGDHDGDEVNCYVPQSYEARADVTELMLVDHMVLKDGAPIVKFVQHELLQFFEMSMPGKLFPREHAERYLFAGGCTLRYPADWVLGTDIISSMLPADFYLDHDELKIRDGRIVSGRCNKNSLNGRGGVIHVLAQDYSGSAAVEFMSVACRVMDAYQSGISVGWDDCQCVPMPHLEVNKQNGLKFLREHKVSEEDACMMVDRIRDQMGSYALDHVDPDNAFVKQIQSGAKGNNLNYVQIAVGIGQLRDDKNQRMRPPDFERTSTDPTALGFVESCYRTGLNPREMFQQLGASREGLAATAVGTAKTGYLQRRIITFLQDAVVAADGCVRMTDGRLLQSLYGGDGFDPMYMERMDGIYTPVHFKRELGRLGNPAGPCNPSDHLQVFWHHMERLRTGESFKTLLRQYTSSARLAAFSADQVRNYLERIYRLTLQRRIPHGDMVGMKVGQRIGEQATQQNLNKFHSSGQVCELNQGVPRIAEIINCKRAKVATMQIYVKDGVDKDVFGRSLISAKFHDIVDHIEYKRPDGGRVAVFIKLYDEGEPDYYITWYLRQGITAYHVAKRLSVSNSSLMWMYGTGWVCLGVHAEDLAQNDLLGLITFAESFVNKSVFGVEGINGYAVVGDHIVTHGSNLLEMMCHPSVRYASSSCVVETFRYLGIDAARAKIEEELAKVIVASGGDVVQRHISLLAHRITRDGRLNPMTASGMDDMSVIGRACFENAMKNFFGGAVSGTFDKCIGVHECLLFNTRLPGGTGSVYVHDRIDARGRFELPAWPKPRRFPKLHFLSSVDEWFVVPHEILTNTAQSSSTLSAFHFPTVFEWPSSEIPSSTNLMFPQQMSLP